MTLYSKPEATLLNLAGGTNFFPKPFPL